MLHSRWTDLKHQRNDPAPQPHVDDEVGGFLFGGTPSLSAAGIVADISCN